MPNDHEYHCVTAPPVVRLRWYQKLAYMSTIFAFCAVPVVITITCIPYMRNKMAGVQQGGTQGDEEDD